MNNFVTMKTLKCYLVEDFKISHKTDLNSIVTFIKHQQYEMRNDFSSYYMYHKKDKEKLASYIAGIIIPDGDENDICYDDIEQCVDEMLSRFKMVYEIDYCYTGKKSLFDILEKDRKTEYSAEIYSYGDDTKAIFYSPGKFNEDVIGLRFTSDESEIIFIATNEKLA